MIDARSQTGTAPDEQTAMRYPTRASELDHRRLQVPPSPLHDPSPNQLHPGVENAAEPARARHVRSWPDPDPPGQRSALPGRATNGHDERAPALQRPLDCAGQFQRTVATNPP